MGTCQSGEYKNPKEAQYLFLVMEKAKGSSVEAMFPGVVMSRYDPSFPQELSRKIQEWELELEKETGIRHTDRNLGNIFMHTNEDGSETFTYVDCVESMIWE